MPAEMTRQVADSLLPRTNWLPTRSVDPDEVIDAWEKGVEHGTRTGFERGREAERRALERAERMLLTANLERAFDVSESLFDRLAETGVNCEKVFLRVEEIDRFSTAFLIPEADFVSDSIDKAYQAGAAVEAEANSRDFSYEFMFVPHNEHTDIRCLEADGFRFRYPETAPEAD